MAERDFYNLNVRISYPLVHGDPTAFLTSGLFPREALVDAGFILGRKSGFSPDVDSVYLYSVVVHLDGVTLNFRSGAPGFSGWQFSFFLPVGTPFGATCYEDAVNIAGAYPDSDYGTGFITVGDLSGLEALTPGTYVVDGILRVEPALLQTEVDALVSDVSLANKARCCPIPCSNQSSSSSSSEAPVCDPDAIYPLARGLAGDILFKEGYNVTIQLNETFNALLFDARVGYGDGETCEDTIIDGEGDSGFHKGDFCMPCDDVIRSVNGREIPEGKLVLVGWPGVEITLDQNAFEVGVKLDSEKFCGGI
jgi:hypothetical protein